MENLNMFKEAVAAKIAGINEVVLERVVDYFGEREAERLQPILIKGYEQEGIAKKALGKFKPENMYDDDGKIVATHWPQQTWDAKKKAEEAVKRWSEALEEVITKGDYQALEKLVKNLNNNNKNDESSASKNDQNKG